MPDGPAAYVHVSPAAIHGSLAGRKLVFVHIPKTAGTTFDRVLETVALLDGCGHFRALGTVYGQYMGPEKDEAADSFRSADSAALDGGRFLSGHLPATVWDERLNPQDAAFVTLLRDPVERTISQYRFGIQRGGWDAGTPMAELFAAGTMADNLQVRMLAGCESPDVPCDEAMLEAARAALAARFAVTGVSDTFDAFLGALIRLCGWPEIIYSSFQVGRTHLAPGALAGLRAQAAGFNRFDQALLADVRAHGPVWINRTGRGPAPAREDMILIVSPGIKAADGTAPRIARDDLPSLAAALEQQGTRLIEAAP